VPTVDLAEKVVDIGNCSGRVTDKFARFGLTARDGDQVKAPLVVKCLANLECRVADDHLSDSYILHVLEVAAVRYDGTREKERMLHHNGDGTFTVEGLPQSVGSWRGLSAST
jgi:flavin reductase (DIM6/NTAB) family NADH-FMN oxidoreductase RutF